VVNDYNKYFNPPESLEKGYSEYGYRGLEELKKANEEIKELRKELLELKKLLEKKI
jgi:hypothetical protein